MELSKSKIRFYIYAIALLPFMLLLATGVIMLYYHTGAPNEALVIGGNGSDWRLFHQVLCVISSPLILLHLLVKTDWVKRFFTFKVNGRFKRSNLIIFIVFSFCLLTAMGSWLIFSETETAVLLRGIHNKLGLLLIILFAIHLINYYKVIIGAMTQIIKKS